MSTSGKISITIEKTPCGELEVSIEPSAEVEHDFVLLMTACEYLLHLTASRSHAGYDRALELLVEGARDYFTQTATGEA